MTSVGFISDKMTPLSALISLERRNGRMWHSGAISVKENNQKDCRIAINSRKEPQTRLPVGPCFHLHH